MPRDCCPYLEAIAETSRAPRSLPCHRHRCMAGGQSKVVSPRTQASFCLTDQHVNCPFFAAGAWTPAQSSSAPKASTWSPSTMLWVLAFLVVAAGIVLWWTQAEAEVVAAPAVMAQSVAVVTATFSPTRIVAPTFTPTATSTVTPLPEPTATHTPTSMPTPTFSPTMTPTPERPPAGEPPHRLRIPAIDLDATVVVVSQQIIERDDSRMATWMVVDNDVGFHRGSAYPGHEGNTVLSGHHNIQGEVFRFLVDVPIGAMVLLYTEDQIYSYVVLQKMVLPERDVSFEQRQENAHWIGPFSDERLTMVTCWPYENNTHRLIVIAKPPKHVPDHPGLRLMR